MTHPFKRLMPLVSLATVVLLSIQPAYAATAAWAATGAMTAPRTEHTAALLNTGKVLVVGGNSGTPFVPAYASAELYNPTSGTWAATGRLTVGRTRHTATLLADGRVLVAGGFDAANNVLASAELYDPLSGTWTATGSMTTAHNNHAATLLADGRVLVAGRLGPAKNPIATAELYDPATGTWTATGSMSIARAQHAATRLTSGQVVVGGGSVVTGNAASAEVYTSDTSTPPGPADKVTVKLAQYDTAKHVLSVGATSTSASARLAVAVTSTGQSIGTLTNSGGATYEAQFNWPTNPLSITIKSSLGGASTATVITKWFQVCSDVSTGTIGGGDTHGRIARQFDSSRGGPTRIMLSQSCVSRYSWRGVRGIGELLNRPGLLFPRGETLP